MTEQFQPELNLGANNLPHSVPIHLQFVHMTLGLFIIAIIFDIAGTLFPLEKPIFKFFGLTALRSSLFTVGWYNLFAAAVITFFTVAAGFFELFLATPPPGTSAWGLSAGTTMLIHGVAGVFILTAIVGMTLWRGLQRYRWRRSARREVQWSYLLVGIAMLGILFIHGTLGAQLGDEFGIHNTAANLVRQGQNPNLVLK
ncbi:DUF2231 domain-containing protein [Leptolyngbya boryana CZ1]|uniref:DUF2231 domain-containing protein n=1 Tax=Leptolyngbya boryana CZ1 TaxID=3060204 RepID=A0AA96XAC1_LEPBY|nr:DUF2231 domain-containing protein [Leptolyngbya boryana]WNZ48470.1 DUF2231 domain-containing protein [Leptolyngbya boryana CZ1]